MEIGCIPEVVGYFLVVPTLRFKWSLASGGMHPRLFHPLKGTECAVRGPAGSFGKELCKDLRGNPSRRCA